jgi:predicted ATP-grasp superfamily ATP-dependent carboligase
VALTAAGGGSRGRPNGQPVVLIGFAEALAAPEVSWSLQDAGFAVVAFHRRGGRPALRRLRGLVTHPITPPELDAHRAVSDVQDLARETNAVAVMPLNDSAVWLIDAAGEGLSVPVVGPTGDLAQLALDKSRQLEGARRAGYATPLTLDDSVGDILAEAPYPCVVKPALAVQLSRGRLVSGSARVCADRRELDAALRDLSGVRPLLIQPQIIGCGEGVFGLAGGDGVAGWSAHRRVRMVNPVGSGSSACVSIPVEAEVRDHTVRLLEAGAWRGLFMVELLRDRDGRAWFMELNGRPWGSMALARRQGFEYPAWAVQDALGQVPAISAAPPAGALVCRHVGRELVHLLFVLRGPRSTAGRELWPGRLQTIRDLMTMRRGDRLYNWRRKNLGFFLEDTWQTVAGVVAGNGHR